MTICESSHFNWCSFDFVYFSKAKIDQDVSKVCAEKYALSIDDFMQFINDKKSADLLNCGVGCILYQAGFVRLTRNLTLILARNLDFIYR